MLRVTRRLPTLFALLILPVTALAADKPVPGGLMVGVSDPEPSFVLVEDQIQWKLMALANNPAFVKAEAKEGTIVWTWKVVRVETNDHSPRKNDPNWEDDPDWNPVLTKSKHKIRFTSIDSKSTSSKATLEGVFVTSGFKRVTVHVTLSFTDSLTDDSYLLLIKHQFFVICINNLYFADGCNGLGVLLSNILVSVQAF